MKKVLAERAWKGLKDFIASMKVFLGIWSTDFSIMTSSFFKKKKKERKTDWKYAGTNALAARVSNLSLSCIQHSSSGWEDGFLEKINLKLTDKLYSWWYSGFSELFLEVLFSPFCLPKRRLLDAFYLWSV